jgi:hypothetical protein
MPRARRAFNLSGHRRSRYNGSDQDIEVLAMRSSTITRRLTACFVAATVLTAPVAGLRAQGAPNGGGQPPHAWLFGTWTGGLFPVPSTVSAAACLGEPVVIFTRDIVMRATLTDVTYTQRVIATARTNPGVTDFQFAPTAAPQTGLFGVAPTPAAGFGCDSPDVLHVQRRSDNEITFPGCADFPNPLVRCPSR